MSLIGLPDTYRFAVFNGTGAILSNSTGYPKASGRRVRYDSNGVLSYEAAEFTFLSTNNSVGINSYVTGSTLSNTASNYLAIDGLLSAFGVSAASGNVYLYLEESPDGGTTWPTPASANGPGGALLVAVMGVGSLTTVSTASTMQRIYWTYP